MKCRGDLEGGGGGQAHQGCAACLQGLVGWESHCPDSRSLQWGNTAGHKDAPSSAASPAQSLGSWGYVGHPWGRGNQSLMLLGCAMCPRELSLTSQMFRSVVWPWIFQSYGSWWPWDSHMQVPLATTQVSMWIQPCFTGRCLPPRLRTDPFSISPGWALHCTPTASQTIPTPSRTPRWP